MSGDRSQVDRGRQQQDRGGADIGNRCAVQFYRGGAVDRMASPGDRKRRERVRPDGAGGVTVSLLEPRAAAVSSGNQPPRRVFRRRRAVRLGQARRLVRRRGGDGGPVRTRVLEGNVKRYRIRAHAMQRHLNRPARALSSPARDLVSDAFKTDPLRRMVVRCCVSESKTKSRGGRGRHQATSITIISPPPPRISTLLFVVWWPMWQWISHFPGCRAVQMTS
jgi:hypothetical protein